MFFSRYGNSDPTRGQRSYAHELTHNLGFDHISPGFIDQVGWDVDARQVRRARGTALIRVFVSDGLNTSFADVGGLTNSGGRRSGGDRPPERDGARGRAVSLA